MDIIKAIKSLYDELPEVSCKGCGLCCVSPTCTLAEFIYLMHNCQKSLPPEAMEKFLLSEPRMHEGHEGNLVCAFLKENRCMVHLYRTGACRVFGIPALEKLGIADMVSCFNAITVTKGRGDDEFIRSWLENISRLNAGLYQFGREPYHVYGFNLECWLDVYFDDLITVEVFSDVRDIMNRIIDLSQYRKRYAPKTGLKEKVDKITLLSLLLGSGDRETLAGLLASIRDDYPLTGSYFVKEAQTLLDALGNKQ
jgi:hypothetical protein